ncbi:uncharacterized protein LOC126069349 isoform X2 [Elephas maximus indicus]|uniref:uncharacterized protein LOC126069349 isoform X2 n=1 Tax=Elephas maximus indicus TaxID=99487 RepID=UPI002115D055|nr:uncharacterized protein LOC126069349 isoform X2 [Elephas maximus indicus]
MNTGVHKSIGVMTLISLGYIPRSGIAGSYGISISSFLRKCHIIFQVTFCCYLHIAWNSSGAVSSFVSGFHTASSKSGRWIIGFRGTGVEEGRPVQGYCRQKMPTKSQVSTDPRSSLLTSIPLQPVVQSNTCLKSWLWEWFLPWANIS